MNRALPFSLLLIVTSYLGCRPIAAQAPEIKFIADTQVVQADGTYQADPDLATLAFDISAQDKELKQTYDQASSSMQIINLAEKNGLKKDDKGERRKRAKYYLVQGEITLRIHDFSKLGPILEGSVEDGITDFRSLSYSLSDEEAAKQKAVAEAMKHALRCAIAALEPQNQKEEVSASPIWMSGSSPAFQT